MAMAILIFTQTLYFNILQSKTKKTHGVHDFWHLFKTLVEIDEDGHDVALYSGSNNEKSTIV
jgi:hypothetical protein